MPKELLKDFMNQKVTIIVFNESFGITGKIVAVEDNWLKIEEKKSIRLINGDMIMDIRLVPDNKKSKSE